MAIRRRTQHPSLEGVALIINSRFDKLVGWKPLGPRLLKTGFNSRYISLTEIVRYVPVEEETEEGNVRFYGKGKS